MKKINSKNFENKINTLIEKAQSNAINPLAAKILGFIAMIESIVFPIPVDPFLAGLTLAAPHKTFRFAMICTIGSVLGGVIGWLLGYLIGPSIETLILNIPWFTQEKFDAVKEAYKDNGILIIFIGAFTPLPYKVITLTSGMAGVNLIAFILISAVGRGVRFFIVAYLIKFFGNPAIILLKNNMLVASTILGIAIIMISFYIF